MAKGTVIAKRRREVNPLLVKELRGRMRGARAFVVLTVYLLLLGCFVSVIYFSFVSSMGQYGGSELSGLGQVIFYTVAVIQILMVTFITPAFTASAIVGERERKTYDLLRATLLSARRLVSGKLFSALTYVLLLILVAVPLESLAFMLGGVVVSELLPILAILLATAFAFAAMGLYLSSVARTTLSATVLSYVVALLLTIGLPILLIVLSSLLIPVMIEPDSWVVEAVFQYAIFFLASLSPIAAGVLSEVLLVEQDILWYDWIDLGYSYSSSGPHRILIPSPWLVLTVVYVIVGTLLLWLAIRRVKRQERE